MTFYVLELQLIFAIHPTFSLRRTKTGATGVIFTSLRLQISNCVGTKYTVITGKR